MLTPSPEAQTLLMVFSGEKWPSINEDLLREAAGHYDKLIGNFQDLQTYLVAVERYVKENFSGKSADEFEKYAKYLSGGDQASILNACAGQAENLAKIARDTANQAEYSKWMILGQVIQLMVEMAFEAAVSWIPGLNAVAHANTVAAEITLRIVVQQVIKALIKSILIHTAMSVAIGTAMDVAVQLIQKGMGNRTDWDLEATKGALGFGALQGLFGGVFSPIGGALGKQVAKLLGSDATKWLSTQIGKHLDTLGAKEGAKAGASKGLANSLGDILGGTEGQLAKNLDKSTGKLISDSFVDKVGDAFAKFGFHDLQGDAARNLGKAWAGSLNKHWTTEGSIDAVSRNIADDLSEFAKNVAKNGGARLDPAALNALSHSITQDVAKSLSSKAMAEALTRTQKFGFAAGLYGTSALVDAGAQNLAEGTYNSMTQGEFTTSWQTFVSGVAPTMFSHAVRHTIVHPLIARSDSGFANFIKDLHTKFDTLDRPGGELGPRNEINSTQDNPSVTPAPNAGELPTVSQDDETGPDTDLEAEENFQESPQKEPQENPQSPPTASPGVTPVKPVVTETPAHNATQTPTDTSATKPVASPSTVVPPTPTNQTGASRTVTQVLNQAPNPAPSATESKSTVPPPIQRVRQRPTESSPFVSEANATPHYGAVNSRRSTSNEAPFTDQTDIPMQDLLTSEESITSAPNNDARTTVQTESTGDTQVIPGNADDVQIVPGDNLDNNDNDENSDENNNENNDQVVIGDNIDDTQSGNSDDQGRSNTQPIHGTNDDATAATTTPPPIEVIDSAGKKKTYYIPDFLNNVSAYGDDNDPSPFNGAVGGHHIVQLTHGKDFAQLADELAKKAKVTLNDLSELSSALKNEAGTFLGDGRRFVVTEGGRTRELRVKATPDQKGWEAAPGDSGKQDSAARNQQTEGSSYSDSSNVQVAVAAAATAGGAAAKATVTPAMGTGHDSNLNTQQLSQRETRSHGPSVRLSTNVTYELTLHDIPTADSTSAQNPPNAPEPIKHTVAKGLVVQVPEAHTSNKRPDPRKDRVPLKFTTESGERAKIEHTESHFNIDPMTDWVLQHTESPIGSDNYKAVVSHFSAEHFTQIDGRNPVPSLHLREGKGTTVNIGTPKPKRHWVIDSSTDFELRDTNQFSEKNESSATRSHTLDASVFVGAVTDPTGFSDSFAAPRAQAGGTLGYSHASSNTSNLGGTAGAKNAERSPKDVRTVLVMRESEVTVKAGDSTKTFIVGSLVRMPVSEAQRLAGWDNQEQLRVGTNEPKKPAYWNTGNSEGTGDTGSGKVTMLGPGRPSEIKFGKETSDEETPNQSDPNGSGRNQNDRNENTEDESRQNENTGSEDPTVRNAQEKDPRKAEEELVDSLIDDLKKADPNLPLATRDEVEKAIQQRSWFKRLFRRDGVSVRAVANTRSLMVAVAKQGMDQRMHQAATKEGVRVLLIGSSLTRDRGYTLTIRADLDQPTYVGSARRTATQAFSGGERFDAAFQTTHTASVGAEATFSAYRNEKDAFGATTAIGNGAVNARYTYRSTRQTKSGQTATREDLFAPSSSTDYYDFTGNLTFELERSSFPQPLVQALTLGSWRALARYGSESRFPAVKWLYEKSGLGGIGETREGGDKSVFLTPHPIKFTFGVPDSLSKTGDVSREDQDRIAGRTESSVLAPTAVQRPDEISPKGITTVTLAARSDRTMFGSVRDLIGKTSGNAWRLTDAGSFMSERTRRIFGQHSFTSLSDQVFSPGGHTVGNLHDKGTLFAGEESLSITGTRHNLKVVGEPFTASPETNTALEQAFGFSKGHAHGATFGTSGAGGGLQGAGDVNFTGQGGVSSTWLQKFWNRNNGSSATSMRDLNQVMGSDRWVMVVADTDFRVAAHHKPLGLFGRPFGSSRDAETYVISKPGGWVGLMRESDALKAGLINDGLGETPKGALDDVEWQDREGLNGATRGAFAHNAPQDAAQLKKLNDDLRKAGIAERTVHTINGMVSARSGRSAIQSGSTLTSRGRTSALTHIKELNVLGKDVVINVQHRRVGPPKVVDTLFGDHEFGAGRNISEEKSSSTTTSSTHSVNGGEPVRGAGGSGGATGVGGGGLGDANSATESVSGVVTQVTTIPGPKAVMQNEWETVVTVTYSDGTNVIEPVKWKATVTTSESYLFLDPKAEGDTSQTAPPNPRPKSLTVEVPKDGSDPAELLKETAKKNAPSARMGDGGFHIHEVIGADQVQNLGKLLVAKSRSNDQKLKAPQEYKDDEIMKEVKKAVSASDMVKPGKAGADALDAALSDISLTAALSSGNAQSGQHAVTVTNNSLVGGVDTTLVVATHLDFKSPKVRRIAVTSNIRFDDLTGTGTGTEMSDTTSMSSAGGPGVAGTVARNGVTTAPGLPVAGVSNTSSVTHKLGQAEQSRTNLKPPAGHGHLYAVPATFHLAAGSQHHIKDTISSPSTEGALQSGTTEATVLVWLSDERVKELGLHTLTQDEIDAAKAVKEAEEAWEANYKEYWEQRRRVKTLETDAEAARAAFVELGGNPENAPATTSDSRNTGQPESALDKARKNWQDREKAHAEGLRQLKDLAKKIPEAGDEYVRLRRLTDKMFSVPNSTAAEPIAFKKTVRHDHDKPVVENAFKEVMGEDGNPAAITIDGTTHPLKEVENDGNGFFNALAKGFEERGDESLPKGSGPELRHILADELQANANNTADIFGNEEIAEMVTPDLADAFDRQDVLKAELDELLDDPTSPAGKEFRDRGAIPPMKTALTRQQRIMLASISAGRDGDREILTDHGAADLYPALAAALWDVPVTVANGKKLLTFMPDASEAKAGDMQRGVMLHLKDGTYRYVDQSSTLPTPPETTPAETAPTPPEVNPTEPNQQETPPGATQQDTPPGTTRQKASAETVTSKVKEPETTPEVNEPEITPEVRSPEPSPTLNSGGTRDEQLDGSNVGNTVAQDIFNVLTFAVDDELASLAKQLKIPVMGIVALDLNLKNLGIGHDAWFALDNHLARNGTTLSAFGGTGDTASLGEAVADWLTEPVQVPTRSIRDTAAEYSGMSPSQLEQLLRTHDLSNADGLAQAINDNPGQGPVTEAADVVEWFATHRDDIALLRNRQDAERLTATMDHLGLTPDANGGQQLATFRGWFADNGGQEHLARATDEQLRDAVARWHLESRQELGNLPADTDVHALLRLDQTARSTGTTTQFHQDVTHHLDRGNLAETVALADALGHGATLHQADALTRALKADVTALKPFGQLLGRRLAQHAGAPQGIQAAADAFRVDLASHGFSVADLSVLATKGDGQTKADPIGAEELESFAHYLAHQQEPGTTPHAAVRAWRNLPTAEAATHVETWRGNDTAEGKVLGTVNIVPPDAEKSNLLGYLGRNGLGAFKVQRVELPNGDIRSDITIPIKLVHEQGQEHLAAAARKVARTSLDLYINSPRYRLPNGDLLHVSVEFTEADVKKERWDNGVLKSPVDGIHLVELSYGPGSRMEARSWKLPSDHLSVFAHEITHLLGPWDYYREHANLLRPVYTDRALMGGPVFGDRFGNVTVGSLHVGEDRLHNQRLMPRDLRLIGTAIEEAWKNAGHAPAPHDGLRSELPLHVAERVLRGDPSTGKAGHLAPVGTGGRVRPEPLGDVNPNGTYLAAGGGPDNAPIMMFPEHWSLEEAGEAAVHVHREQRRRGNIDSDGTFEGVHHGVRITGHARPDGTITHFEPSKWQGDLAPRPFADPAVEPRSKPFAEGGDPMSSHRLWDFLDIGDRSLNTGGQAGLAADLDQKGRNSEAAPVRKAVTYDLFTEARSRGGARRAVTYSLDLTQNAPNQDIRSVLTSPGPVVTVSDGVSGLNTVFPEEWDRWYVNEVIDVAHRDALRSGNFIVLPSGGHIWHTVIDDVAMHGQVLDGEHQWAGPSWRQSGLGTSRPNSVLAEARDIDFHTGDGAHYRMHRTLRENGRQTTEIIRVLHVSNDDAGKMVAETLRSVSQDIGNVPGLGRTRLKFAVEPNGPENGPDTDVLNLAESQWTGDLSDLLGPGYETMYMSAPRNLRPDEWTPPEGRDQTPIWAAYTTAMLDRFWRNPLNYEPGVDTLVQMHTAERLAPHADRERSERDLVGATNQHFHAGAGNDLKIPETLRGDWTRDRVRLAALQHSSHARPAEGRSTADEVVLEAFPEPNVRLEIRHARGADGQWKITDYSIHAYEGDEVPPLWQPDQELADAAAGVGVPPAHLFVLSEALGVPYQGLSSAAGLLRGTGDPLAVLTELQLMSGRLGVDDPARLTERMSAFGIGAEHWWDLAAHLQSSGHTVSDFITAGPDSDLATAWEQRTQRPVRRDILEQAHLLGVHPRRLEMVMNFALIDDPRAPGMDNPRIWAATDTPQRTAELLFGAMWRDRFGEMVQQFGAASTVEGAPIAFSEWSQAPDPTQPPPLHLLGLEQITRAVALWRLGRNGPGHELPDGSDPRPLALLVSSLGMTPEHANAYIQGPGHETGTLPMTTHLEQRYEAAEDAAWSFHDQTGNMPNVLDVLALSDGLGISPDILPVIAQLIVAEELTVSDLLRTAAPLDIADGVWRLLDNLGLDPRELAWFGNLMMAEEHIRGFWEYVTAHRTSDADLMALWEGNREAGPAAAQKWIEYMEELYAAEEQPPAAPEAEQQHDMAYHSSVVNDPRGSAPLPVPEKTLPDTLLDLAKQLSSASAENRTDLADPDLFQGSSPAARDARMAAFRNAMLQAQTTTVDVDERAAHIASDIKSNQYFTDGNTRTATAAVFTTYAAAGAGAGLDATPLEVFAAIAEAEVNPHFDLTEWLRERHTDDGPATVPSVAELEEISVVAGQLAYVAAGFQRIEGYLRDYLRRHPEEPEEDAREEFLAELLGDSEADYDLWAEREEFARAIDLIRPGGRTGFLNTVAQRRAPKDTNESLVEEIERLMEELGLDE
ncbi:hypothetical protein ACFCV8_23900 [Streptomyces sp. NPDC056347]|uniref:WXG100-like domain-containing protein n=1 Tax=Streptomyces sp. NPDC056347 TaxID=3345790 RepID=UPI0035D81B43